jgi:RNA polymerase sigma-70 factor (ECF subfamily)
MTTDPFDAIVRTHRRELLVHCYRMLGSWTDAEDVLQDVLLRGWRGFARFEGRASARSWLYLRLNKAFGFPDRLPLGRSKK